LDPTVYVVDDEAVIATTLSIILKQSGFNARPFTNPLTALQAAGSEPPNLLLSDVMMPDLSGVELAIRMKTLCPACKVLLFSGQAATTDLLEEARKSGHEFTLLSKPVHPADLLATLRKING
jgi:CheY-like chemotaxis protein